MKRTETSLHPFDVFFKKTGVIQTFAGYMIYTEYLSNMFQLTFYKDGNSNRKKNIQQWSKFQSQSFRVWSQ